MKWFYPLDCWILLSNGYETDVQNSFPCPIHKVNQPPFSVDALATFTKLVCRDTISFCLDISPTHSGDEYSMNEDPTKF